MSSRIGEANPNNRKTIAPPIEPGTRAIRPVDAASLILIDRSHSGFRVLLGKRHARHVFMPETYVFPGGRRERGDGHARFAQDLDHEVRSKLLCRVPASTSPVRARALAIAAIRETQEETGLQAACGRDGTLCPDLSSLRFVARAITPPGQLRRYDARFFACFTDEADIDPRSVSDSDELIDLRWVALSNVGELPLPRITQVVLDELTASLAADPTLPHGRDVPFHFMRRGTFVRELL